MTDCIIGGCYGYTYDQIKFWINSINRSGFQGDRVLILFDSPDELVQKVQEQGFTVVRAQQDPNIAPHVMRFIAIYDFLSQREYDRVVTTDVRDVIFQYDPIKWLHDHAFDHKIVCGSEGLYYRDEPWGNQNLYETFGPYIYEKFKNNVIFNVGVLAGDAEYVRDLVLSISVNSLNRPIKICDQAVFNFLIQNKIYEEQTFFARSTDRWATHLGTFADPSKMHHFGPRLLEQGPEFDGTKVNINGHPFCIVHQYDRTPWKQAIEEIYS